MWHQQSALVTGASTGIGRAIAQSLVEQGWRVFGSVRKAEDGATVAGELGENFHAVSFDVTNAEQIAQAAQEVSDALGGRTLNGLVNNAGVAVGGPLRYIPLDDIEFQMNVNVLGPVRVTQAFLPILGADKRYEGAPGRIVNMSSVAGKNATPILGPYAMSKHALEAYSESLRRELLMHGIDVIIVGPGAIKTPIWDKADEIDAERYADTEYYGVLKGMRDMYKAVGQDGLEPSDVGALVAEILTMNKPKTRYAIMREKFTTWILPKFLPKRLVDRIIAKRFGFPKSAS
ncbi:MAG: SDR family oxidoreductase [Pseudomonadota bacterium]